MYVFISLSSQWGLRDQEKKMSELKGYLYSGNPIGQINHWIAELGSISLLFVTHSEGLLVSGSTVIVSVNIKVRFCCWAKTVFRLGKLTWHTHEFYFFKGMHRWLDKLNSKLYQSCLGALNWQNAWADQLHNFIFPFFLPGDLYLLPCGVLQW